MKDKTRNTNLEILRIISMYMIVFIHANRFLPHFCTGAQGTFYNGLVNGICNAGVSCFILISGYFGMKFKLNKLVKMECMMITFSLLETLFLVLAFPEQMQGAVLAEALIKSLLPVISRKYWFYSCYVCLYLFSGFIESFTEKIEKKNYEKLLCLLLVLFSVFPTLFYFEIMQDNGKGLVQMFMVYLIGDYIKRYRNISLPKPKAWAALVFLWVFNGISHEIPLQIGGIYHHLCKDNSITNIILAIILFYLFKDIKIQSGTINGVTKGIFAVFALNNTFVNIIMKLFEERGWPLSAAGLPGFLLLAGIVLLVMFACLLIGKVRELLLWRADAKIAGLAEKTAGIIQNRLSRSAP